MAHGDAARVAELESADADFGRFRGLRWSNPLNNS
jgi:hypothetical protein